MVPGVEEEESEPAQKKRKVEMELPKGKEGKMEENTKLSNEDIEEEEFELDRVLSASEILTM